VGLWLGLASRVGCGMEPKVNLLGGERLALYLRIVVQWLNLGVGHRARMVAAIVYYVGCAQSAWG
jgi:hypothetical protein